MNLRRGESSWPFIRGYISCLCCVLLRAGGLEAEGPFLLFTRISLILCLLFLGCLARFIQVVPLIDLHFILLEI